MKNEYRYYCNKQNKILRDDIAKTYRQVRKENPAMARLFYQRTKAVEKGTFEET